MTEHEMTVENFFERAYWMQRGEYYPEIHRENIDELCQLYTWDRDIVNALYRILPHFDCLAKEEAKKVNQGIKTPEQGYNDLLLPIFHFIPESVKKSAWDLHLSSLCLIQVISSLVILT